MEHIKIYSIAEYHKNFYSLNPDQFECYCIVICVTGRFEFYAKIFSIQCILSRLWKDCNVSICCDLQVISRTILPTLARKVIFLITKALKIECRLTTVPELIFIYNVVISGEQNNLVCSKRFCKAMQEIKQLLYVIAPGSRGETRGIHERLQTAADGSRQGRVRGQNSRALVLLNTIDRHLQYKGTKKQL